ncbi:MAG TPA: helix-turn-helix domain-containing protein, partial [Thermomicrobiales bacterium]|nr:helix-turn-helix domain-containing protein [Thermomicrobiales bacterium]
MREPVAAVSAQAAAALLGVHERTIRRAIRRGELAASKQGGRFAIAMEALERYRRDHGPFPADAFAKRPRLALAPEPTDRAEPIQAPAPLFEPPRWPAALPAP